MCSSDLTVYTALAAITINPFAIEFPDSLKAQIIGFLLLIALFMLKVKPGLSAMLGARTTRIEEAQVQVDTALAETQRLHDDYAARLKGIEREARSRIDEAVQEAETVRGEIIAEAQQTSVLIRRRAEEELAREQTRQRILLHRLLVQQTIDAAEHSVTVFSGEDVQRQLIQNFVTEVAQPTNAGKEA